MSAASGSSSKASAVGGEEATKRQDEGLGEQAVAPSMSLTSDEVNYLVFRYMQEAGFVHSAFTFVYESMLGRSNIRNAEKTIPPGALVNFLQKGLQYVGIEESLQRENSKPRKAGATSSSTTTNSNSTNTAENDIETNNTDLTGLSLLSPQTIAALTKEQPKIQLSVPPASAAAAVRARLEAEAKMYADRKAAAVLVATESLSPLNGRKNQSIPPQPMIMDDTSTTNALATAAVNSQNVLAARAAVAVAAAGMGIDVGPLRQSTNGIATSNGGSGSSRRQTPAADSAGAAAFVAQQRRAVAAADGTSTQEQHQQLLHLNQRQQQQQQDRSRDSDLQQQHDSSIPPGSVGSGLMASSTSEQQQVGNKRPLGSSKKGQKNKGKSSKQRLSPKSSTSSLQQQQQQQQQDKQQSSLQQNQGFASLDEAAARLEALRGEKLDQMSSSIAQHLQQQQQQQMPLQQSAASTNDKVVSMDVDESDHHVDAQAAVTVPAHEKLSLITSKSANPNGVNRHPPNGVHNMHGGGYGESSVPQQQLQMHANGDTPGHAPVDSVPPLSSSMPMGVVSMPADKPLHRGKYVNSPADSTDVSNPKIDQENELTNADASEVLDLKKHSSEVFMCAWNPIFTSIIATGSGDASARIWKMAGPKAIDGLGPTRLLPHGSGPKDKKNKDVTTLEWSSDGMLLATGSYDGVARVWNQDGLLVHTLQGHKGPIFSLKWNKRGNFLLSGSYDKTTIVWDVSTSTGFVQQQFNDHEAPALDVDWKDDTTFASCSTDRTVHICRVGMKRPLKTFAGHSDEVNAVKWDPSGTLLASCSDDCTAKIWDFNSDKTDPLHDLKSHQQEIYTVKWSPTGPGSNNPNKQPMLATASFDGSVRLWNVKDGSCFRVFSRHCDSVYSVAFSPSGDFLASGSLAGQLYIWNVQAGVHIKSYKGEGDIFEVAWNKEETRVAACFSSNVVSIIDFKK